MVKKITLRTRLTVFALLEFLKQLIFNAIRWLLSNYLKTVPRYSLKSEADQVCTFSSVVYQDETPVIKTQLKLSN